MGKSFTVALAAFAATGSFLFGYDSGVMTDVIASPNFLEFFNTTQTSSIIGAINSTFSGGGRLLSFTALICGTNNQKAAIGALTAGLTIDTLGRRRTIQLGALISAIGAILQCAARNLAMILVGRIVAGWAVGILSMSVPVYQAECAHPRSRGL